MADIERLGRHSAAPGTAGSHHEPHGAPGRRLVLPRRSLVYSAGDPADTFDEVLSGALALWRLTPDGRRQLVELLLPGDFSGFAAGAIHGSDCEALVATSVIRHRRADIERDETLRAHVIARLEAQLSAMHAHAMVLGRATAQERLAAFLLRLAERQEPDRPRPRALGLRLPLTRSEIAIIWASRWRQSAASSRISIATARSGSAVATARSSRSILPA